MIRVGKWTVFVLLVCVTRVVAQVDCPAIVQAALDATDEQCSATVRNQACYGNVNLQATPQPDVDDFTFSTPGDIVAVSAIESFSLSSQVEETGEWGVALMQLQANIPDTLPGQNVTFLLFGDVQITNGVESNVEPVTLEVAAEGDSNVRSGPSTNDARISSLSDGDVVTAIGRNADESWLQIVLPDETTGWVSAYLVATDGDVSLLNVVDTSQPPTSALTPMQAFYFQSGIGDAPCAEAPDSGILVQTPEGVEQIEFTVNDVHVTLGSTAYLQAQPSGDMTTSVVEGEATVEAGGASVDVPEGSYVSVPLDADGQAAGTPSQPQPYNAARMAVLPTHILPRTITIAAPFGTVSTADEWQLVWNPLRAACNGATTPTGSIDSIQLPTDEFSAEILLSALFDTMGVQIAQLGTTTENSPEPNRFIVDWVPDPSQTVHLDMQVIDSNHIEGQYEEIATGCEFAFSFVGTRVTGAESTAEAPTDDGIIPAAGEWQAAWDPASISCEISSPELSGTLTWDMSYYASFRLPADEFSPALLYAAIFAFDMSFGENLATSSPEPNTYVMDFLAPMGDVNFEVQVIDSEHMAGNYELTNANCVFAFSFEMTRVGD